MDKPRIYQFPDLIEEIDLSPASGLYSNLTLVPTSRPVRLEKTVWYATEDTSPASSGNFGKLLRSTACRKPGKYRSEEAHKVELNLHQFQSDSGDSLGEDPDSWARLTF